MIAAALALVLVSQPAAPERAARPQPSPRAHFLPPLMTQPPLFTTTPRRPPMLPPLETARPDARPASSLLLPI